MLILIAVVLVFGWFAWTKLIGQRRDDVAEDYSHLSYDSPFHNTKPGVQYVGDQVCADCHDDIVATYHKHPMGQALFPISKSTGVAEFDKSAHNPFSSEGLDFHVDYDGQDMFHREVRRYKGKVIAEKKAKIAYILGSGAHGHSFLVNLNGYLFQSPISWYTQKTRWDFSPGYEKNNIHFERNVSSRCLFCHTNRVEAVEHTHNLYRQPIFRGHVIGCERCHGPGELHVKDPHKTNGVNYNIVNPRHLAPPLRDAVCQQCHLQGIKRIVRRGRKTFDFRPGTPLHLYWSVFVLPNNQRAKQLAVNHVEQMRHSHCFRASKGKMGCVTCHNPHEKPAEKHKVQFFRKRCLNCHADTSCSLPLATRHQHTKEDNCLQCHMPRSATADIVHLAITDHRIPRDPDALAKLDDQVKVSPSEIPLLDFHANIRDPRDRDVTRDLGIALISAARGLRSNPASFKMAGKALPLLQKALENDPADVPAWSAKGYALWLRGWGEKAFAAYESALAEAPHAESALADAADLAVQLGRHEKAITLWKRAIKVDPFYSYYHEKLAHIHAAQHEWDLARKACQQSLQLNPFRSESRRLLVECYAQLGDQKQAHAELEILVGLDPTKAKQLRAWFTALGR